MAHNDVKIGIVAVDCATEMLDKVVAAMKMPAGPEKTEALYNAIFPNGQADVDAMIERSKSD